MAKSYHIDTLDLKTPVMRVNFLEHKRWLQIPIRYLNRVLEIVERFLLSLYYTTMVFFGLRMNLEKLRKPDSFTSFVLMSYLFFVYALGLFCVGYIVNIIFV